MGNSDANISNSGGGENDLAQQIIFLGFTPKSVMLYAGKPRTTSYVRAEPLYRSTNEAYSYHAFAHIDMPFEFSGGQSNKGTVLKIVDGGFSVGQGVDYANNGYSINANYVGRKYGYIAFK